MDTIENILKHIIKKTDPTFYRIRTTNDFDILKLGEYRNHLVAYPHKYNGFIFVAHSNFYKCFYKADDKNCLFDAGHLCDIIWHGEQPIKQGDNSQLRSTSGVEKSVNIFYHKICPEILKYIKFIDKFNEKKFEYEYSEIIKNLIIEHVFNTYKNASKSS